MSDADMRAIDRRARLEPGHVAAVHAEAVRCRRDGHPLVAEWTSRGPRYMHPHGPWHGCHCGARMVRVEREQAGGRP